MSRCHLPLLRSMVWMIALGSCKPNPATSQETYPTAVGPPFGLDRLRGGMPVAEAQALFPKLLDQAGAPDKFPLVLTGTPSGVVVNVHREEGRVGDVEIMRTDCAGLEATLTKAWGPATDETAPPIENTRGWSSAATRWVAALHTLPQGCRLTFTSASYFGTTARAPGKLGRLRPGMTKAEVDAILPGASELASSTPGIADGLMAAHVAPRSKVVDYTYLVGPSTLQNALRMAWGAGSVVAGAAPPSRIWLDAPHLTRARVAEVPLAHDHGPLIYFDGYVPFERWLGAGTDVEILHGAVIGVPLSELRARFNSALVEDDERHVDDQLELPATEWAGGSTITGHVKLAPNQTVEQVWFDLPYESPAGRDAMIASCVKKWGPATQPRDGVYKFAEVGGVAIDLTDLSNSLTLNLARPRTSNP